MALRAWPWSLPIVTAERSVNLITARNNHVLITLESLGPDPARFHGGTNGAARLSQMGAIVEAAAAEEGGEVTEPLFQFLSRQLAQAEAAHTR